MKKMVLFIQTAQLIKQLFIIGRLAHDLIFLAQLIESGVKPVRDSLF